MQDYKHAMKSVFGITYQCRCIEETAKLSLSWYESNFKAIEVIMQTVLATHNTRLNLTLEAQIELTFSH